MIELEFHKSIRQFKLSNGDEIVCDVVEWPDVDGDHHEIVIRNAYKIFMLTPMNAGENRYYQFRPWMVYQDNKEYFQVINPDHIIAEASPSEELLVHYYRIIEELEDNSEDATDDDIEKLKKLLIKTMEEAVDYTDSDLGNLIKFPGSKKIH